VGDPLIPVPRGYDRIVEKSVEGWLGTPYLMGGTTRAGVDCSGFVREVFRESQKVELPRTSTAQATTGVSVAPSELRNGDIVLFDILERGRVSHVGVYMGDGVFAHASSSRGVTRDQFGAKWVQRAFRGSRRILEAQ
jgi:cell wall-associated NlpC family hydrolase